ncbi:MAG: glycoside hydrolase family 2 protein [Rhodobacteraceae bacterium]|nr:glycoside hydrolase family 2 protein [Paracoccaceae bacterium]MCY4328212.1 glycoside hydrolase family 2 protein [Paracoccaceae bacterium]
MRIIKACNDGWIFHEEFSERHRHEVVRGRSVRLPHNAVDLPLNYFAESQYQKQFCYQMVLHCDSEMLDREVHLLFDGAMADTQLFVNGSEILGHRDGYTPFWARLSPYLATGSNLVTVKIDGRENPDIPPFGGQIDYLTYAGIYRDVWLQLTDQSWISDVQIVALNPLATQKSIHVYCSLEGARLAGARLRAEIRDRDAAIVASTEITVDGFDAECEFSGLHNIDLWDIDAPNLYRLHLSLETGGRGDHKDVSFGVRGAEFTPDGFILNGRKLKIRGLNRHQSYPYVGYAMGRRSQERDAEILKHELCCNLVRSSHYPPSPWFLDHCDRIGLLVFEEIPGWQHIGGENWKEESLRNVRRMILRDRNHPSVILWGVRINESSDDHEFYTRTNRLAHQLDPTRQTAGVRCIENSELLEDVYTMNDFVLGSEDMPGANHARIALRKPIEVTGGKPPYMVTEFNGHMFPTKIFDNEERQAEHVLRFLQVLNQAYGDPNVSGCIGWCLADYNTHQEFGSGDRICHHGVLDMFRVPKFAAAVYASQGDPARQPVLMPVTRWARGERSLGGVLPLIILTNCDEVELRVGQASGERFKPDRALFPHLPYAPVIIRNGNFGNWGEKWESMSLTGYVDDSAVVEIHRASDPIASEIRLSADDRELIAGEKDEIRLVVRVCDQFGSALPYLTDPLCIDITGAASLVGPAELAFRGGSAAFWIESTGTVGEITVGVETPRFMPVTLKLGAVNSLSAARFREVCAHAIPKNRPRP